MCSCLKSKYWLELIVGEIVIKPPYTSCSSGFERKVHTCHILPPSEIDLGLFWADFTDLEGKHLFHWRILSEAGYGSETDRRHILAIFDPPLK